MKTDILGKYLSTTVLYKYTSSLQKLVFELYSSLKQKKKSI